MRERKKPPPQDPAGSQAPAAQPRDTLSEAGASLKNEDAASPSDPETTQERRRAKPRPERAKPDVLSRPAIPVDDPTEKAAPRQSRPAQRRRRASPAGIIVGAVIAVGLLGGVLIFALSSDNDGSSVQSRLDNSKTPTSLSTSEPKSSSPASQAKTPAKRTLAPTTNKEKRKSDADSLAPSINGDMEADADAKSLAGAFPFAHPKDKSTEPAVAKEDLTKQDEIDEAAIETPNEKPAKKPADSDSGLVVKLKPSDITNRQGDGPDGRGNSADDTWQFWYEEAVHRDFHHLNSHYRNPGLHGWSHNHNMDTSYEGVWGEPKTGII
jgi:hypothetical protein